MSIRCGNCKGTHASKHEVRGCYHNSMIDQEDPNVSTTSIELTWQGEPFASAAEWPPTQPQLDYLNNLLHERKFRYVTKGEVAAADRAEVSELIDEVKRSPFIVRRPKRERKHERFVDVPYGKYALETSLDHNGPPAEGEESTLQFFEVQHGKSGTRWEGFVFVKRLVGAPGDFARYSLRYAEGQRVLERIQADPDEALVRFGKHFTVCGRCGSPLTKKVSRDRGIGPKCIKKLGW